MSLVSEVISPCTNCKKVHSLAEQLIVNMQAFEVFTMEMELDPKSAKLKSRDVISNFWQLISTIKCVKPLEKQEQGNGIKEEKPPIPRLIIRLKNLPSKMKVEEKPQTQTKAKSESNSNINTVSIHTMRTRQKSNPKPRQNSISKWNPTVSASRMEEINKTKELLRTIKCGTGKGQYNLFECMKCGRQFNDVGSCRRHIQGVHFKLGAPCPTCGTRYFNPKTLKLHIPNCIQRKRRQLKSMPFEGGVATSSKRERKKSVKVHLDSVLDSDRQTTSVKIESVRETSLFTAAEAVENYYENENKNTKASI